MTTENVGKFMELDVKLGGLVASLYHRRYSPFCSGHDPNTKDGTGHGPRDKEDFTTATLVNPRGQNCR